MLLVRQVRDQTIRMEVDVVHGHSKTVVIGMVIKLRKSPFMMNIETMAEVEVGLINVNIDVIRVGMIEVGKAHLGA